MAQDLSHPAYLPLSDGDARIVGIIKLAGDPTAGDGVGAPIGTLGVRSDTGDVWSKTSAGDTGWALLAFD